MSCGERGRWRGSWSHSQSPPRLLPLCFVRAVAIVATGSARARSQAFSTSTIPKEASGERDPRIARFDVLRQVRGRDGLRLCMCAIVSHRMRSLFAAQGQHRAVGAANLGHVQSQGVAASFSAI